MNTFFFLTCLLDIGSISTQRQLELRRLLPSNHMRMTRRVAWQDDPVPYPHAISVESFVHTMLKRWLERKIALNRLECYKRVPVSAFTDYSERKPNQPWN